MIRLGLGLAIVLLLIFISGFGFQRIDLTEEKRHTLTPATVELLQDLEDIVYVKVFLTGEFPAEYKRLERSIKERLDEMKAYSTRTSPSDPRMELVRRSSSPELY